MIKLAVMFVLLTILNQAMSVGRDLITMKCGVVPSTIANAIYKSMMIPMTLLAVMEEFTIAEKMMLTCFAVVVGTVVAKATEKKLEKKDTKYEYNIMFRNPLHSASELKEMFVEQGFYPLYTCLGNKCCLEIHTENHNESAKLDKMLTGMCCTVKRTKLMR